jgi:hypothetical protein
VEKRMHFKTTRKITKALILTAYEKLLEAKYSDDRDVMIVVLDYNGTKLTVEELKKDFILRYKTDFFMHKGCIEEVRRDIGYRCMMYVKRKPKLVVLVPTLKALTILGPKESYRLLFGDSWKGSSLDPFENLVAEYKVLV